MPQTGVGLNELLLQARAGNAEARETILGRLKPFAAQVAARVTGRHLAWENDDELGVALCALNEAIDAYDPAAGAGFQSFAAQVIRRRLIDHHRREMRHRQGMVSLEELSVDPAEPVPAEPGDLPLAVEALRQQLGLYGLDFADLVAASPKHRDTREALIRAARSVAGDPDLRQVLETQRRLPLRELAAKTGLSRRVLERGRRYIVALALVLSRPELYPLRTFAGLNRDPSGGKEGETTDGRP
ncbi:MAG: sigma-70 family RNA polymerase sigma factor [Bacillota bacterium]|nr:sigma-70 family RNA polymerase sigma factor [Bacillota bacterium]